MSENPANYPYYFAWEVPAQGFEWRTDVKLGGVPATEDNPVMVEKSNIKRDKKGALVFLATETIRYHPFHTDTALYKSFAGLSTTKEAILKFANKYGRLGIGEPVSVKADSDDLFLDFFGVTGSAIGESFDRWKTEIKQMKKLCAAITAFAISPEQTALPFIQKANEKLGKQRFRIAFLFDKKEGRTKGYYKPTNLLAAMYLQFFWRVTGEKAPKFCECGCGRFWDSASSRSNRKFFDKACEMRHRRASKHKEEV